MNDEQDSRSDTLRRSRGPEDFGFAQLDSNDRDVSGDSTDGSHHGLPRLDFNPSDYVHAWLFPLGLIGSWLVVFVLELLLGGASAHNLIHWPVVVGDLQHLWLLKGLNAFIGQHVALHSGITGLLMWLLVKILNVVIMAICTVGSGFMHASWAHLFGNILLFVLLCGFYYLLKFPLPFVVRNWAILGSMGIGLSWLVTEMLAMVVKLVSHHPTFFSAITKSTVPIVGASVGLYALLGMGLIQAIKHFRFSIWMQLSLILLVMITIMLLYSRWSSLHDINFATASGSVLLLTVCMHFVGFLLGVIHGFHLRVGVQR